MKQKLASAALVCTLVFLMNILLYTILYKRLLPYYWGSDEISDKREYLIRNKSIYNTIFIGSSKTQNQIIPHQFDQKAKENSLEVRSYNFGIGGLTPLESLHIYENLLVQDSMLFKYAFIELDWIATIKYQNLNATRSFYWLNASNYLRSVNSIAYSSIAFERRVWGLFHYSLDYTENTLNIGKVEEYLKFRKHTKNQIFSKTDSNIVFNGFVPMFHKMNNAEHALYEEVVTSAKMGVENFNTLKNSKISIPFLNRIEEIVSISKKKGINIYFVVPLQWKYYQYKELIPVINAMQGAKVICLFDIQKYKDIYNPEHFADPNHLNLTGAELYTEQLFEHFKSQNIKL